MNKQRILKFISLIIFIGIYFQGVIPVRELTMSKFKSKLNVEMNENIKVRGEGPRAITVYEKGSAESYKARVPFGMNFFIGFIGLILISASKKFYFIEIIVQILLGVLIFLFFLYGVKDNVFLLKISDMISIYFLPLVSLFMVVLAFIEKKALKQTIRNES